MFDDKQLDNKQLIGEANKKFKINNITKKIVSLSDKTIKKELFPKNNRH
ncbi:MAG: hypothetical protein RR847_01200 [Bacilli bacterium]